MGKGYIIKSSNGNEVELDKINQFTRRNFTSDELYTFNVVLCDNDVDRDYESFTVESLEKLAYLFVGKTGIFNHDPKGENQTARVYDTVVCKDENIKTATGEVYTYLLGKAYMIKSDKNRDLILEIDGGIKKEVSVSCTAKSKVCSICGNEMFLSSCEHRAGQTYKGKLCYGILSDITDAYEWSFVAIPAQKNAGVIKHFNSNKERNKNKMANTRLNTNRSIEEICKSFTSSGEGVECGEITLSSSEANLLKKHLTDLESKASLGEEYIKSVQKNVLRLGFLSDDKIDNEVLSSVVSKMSLSELLAFEKAYKLKLENKEGFNAQLNVKNHSETKPNNMFKI